MTLLDIIHLKFDLIELSAENTDSKQMKLPFSRMAVIKKTYQIVREKGSKQVSLIHAQSLPETMRFSMTLPSTCSTTITSIAPLNVAGLMEFHVFETDPPILRTYCMSPYRRRDPCPNAFSHSSSLGGSW